MWDFWEGVAGKWGLRKVTWSKEPSWWRSLAPLHHCMCVVHSTRGMQWDAKMLQSAWTLSNQLNAKILPLLAPLQCDYSWLDKNYEKHLLQLQLLASEINSVCFSLIVWWVVGVVVVQPITMSASVTTRVSSFIFGPLLEFLCWPGPCGTLPQESHHSDTEGFVKPSGFLKFLARFLFQNPRVLQNRRCDMRVCTLLLCEQNPLFLGFLKTLGKGEGI